MRLRVVGEFAVIEYCIAIGTCADDAVERALTLSQVQS